MLLSLVSDRRIGCLPLSGSPSQRIIALALSVIPDGIALQEREKRETLTGVSLFFFLGRAGQAAVGGSDGGTITMVSRSQVTCPGAAPRNLRT